METISNAGLPLFNKMSVPQLSLVHRYKPSALTDRPAPVIFLFHGYGSDEEDLFSFAPELPNEYAVVSARAPYPMQPFGNAWYALDFMATEGKWSDLDQARESRERIVTFMEEAIAAYGFDAENVTLIGFSQGTVLSYAVALSYPEKVRNLIALSGYIESGILVEGFEQKPIKDLNIYVSHGQVDQLIPATWAQASSEKLKAWGIDHVFEEYPVGHGVSPQNFFSFKKWLENRS